MCVYVCVCVCASVRVCVRVCVPRMRADKESRSERLLERLYQHVSAGILQARYASLPQFLADHARTRSCAAEQVGGAQQLALLVEKYTLPAQKYQY